MRLPTAFVSMLLALVLMIGSSNASFAVTVKQVEKATTVDEFVALGATKVSAAQFTSMVVGKEMVGDGWTWIIDTNGTTSSASTDGSWKEDAAPWNMKGDAYCTKIEGNTACRDVYVIGDYMRMSDKSDPSKLSSWTVKLPK